jgi:hypothetical protein
VRPVEFGNLRALNHDVALALTLGRDGPQRWDFEALAQYYDFYNFRPWSFLQVTALARSTRYFGGGFVLELAVRGEIREFTDDVRAPLDYSVIDDRMFGGEMNMKRWLSSSWRVRGGYRVSATRHDPTASTFLLDRSGLGAVEARRDVNHRLDAEVMWSRENTWAVSGGYEFWMRASNSDYYDLRGYLLRGYAVYQPAFGGLLRATALWGVVDFFDRRFDSRFIDTREDFRGVFSLSYRRAVAPAVDITLAYGYVHNDANDSEEFDPRTTLSYGDVTQRSISVSLDYSLDYGL